MENRRTEAEHIAYQDIIMFLIMRTEYKVKEDFENSIKAITDLLNEYPGILNHGDIHNNLTIIHYAIDLNDLEILQLFLKYNPDFNVPTRAALTKHIDAVIGVDENNKRLETKTLRPDDMYSPSSTTPLHKAITTKDLSHWKEMVVLMIKNGANPLGFDGLDFTPLETANKKLSDLNSKVATGEINKEIKHYEEVRSLFENILKAPKYQDALTNLEEAREKHRKEREDYLNKWQDPEKLATAQKEQTSVTKSSIFSTSNLEVDNSQVGHSLKRGHPEKKSESSDEENSMRKKSKHTIEDDISTKYEADSSSTKNPK